MSNTTVEFKEQEFGIDEWFIELISHFICKRMENNGLNTYSTNLNNIHFTSDGNRSGWARGMVSLMLNSYIVSDTDKQDFINVLNQTKTDILSIGENISRNQLNAIEAEKNPADERSDWKFSLKTKSLTNLIDVIIKLINEEDLYNGSNGLYVSFIGFEEWEPRDTVFL